MLCILYSGQLRITASTWLVVTVVKVALLTTESVILYRRKAFLSSFSFLFSVSSFLRPRVRRLTQSFSRTRPPMPHSSGTGIGPRPSSFRRSETKTTFNLVPRTSVVVHNDLLYAPRPWTWPLAIRIRPSRWIWIHHFLCHKLSEISIKFYISLTVKNQLIVHFRIDFTGCWCPAMCWLNVSFWGGKAACGCPIWGIMSG